jgi:superfamily I DNA/RNA helicase
MASAELDLDADVVKVLTFHSAKGLEFPTVVVTGLAAGVLPRVLRGAEAEEREEEERCSRRLVFVGMTRAMRNLLVVYPRASPSPFIAGLDPALWERQGETAPARPAPAQATG